VNSGVFVPDGSGVLFTQARDIGSRISDQPTHPAVMDAPATASELRRRCQAWPRVAVTAAVVEVLRGIGHPAQSALAGLVAEWLNGDDDSDPPPLHPEVVRQIWEYLASSRH
jgi:hypothetical protein